MAASLVGDISSTEWIANSIHEKLGGDIEKLTPFTDYPLGYDECADAAKEETDRDARPEFEPLEHDPAKADIDPDMLDVFDDSVRESSSDIYSWLKRVYEP